MMLLSLHDDDDEIGEMVSNLKPKHISLCLKSGGIVSLVHNLNTHAV